MSAFCRHQHRLPPGWKPGGWHTLHGVLAIGLPVVIIAATLLLWLVLT